VTKSQELSKNFPGGKKKGTENLSEDSRSPSRVLNLENPQEEALSLPNLP
jgi:hypothetical protein